MYEKEKIQLHTSTESVIREMMAGSTLEFHSRDINGVTVTGKLFPYQTIGISGIIPITDAEGNKTKLVTLYLKVIGNWYRVNFDPSSPQTIHATVDLVEKVPNKGLFLTMPIGWVKQKKNGKFDYYSSVADIQIENYEHPDLTETVMKLAVVHDSAKKKEKRKTGRLFGNDLKY
jgi:hypothetical protein